MWFPMFFHSNGSNGFHLLHRHKIFGKRIKKIITIKKTIPQQSNSVFCERTSLVSNKQALFSRVLL